MMIATGQKSGYLDVKVPAKARGKGIKAWKAWKRRWVVVHGMTNVSTCQPVVTIDMYAHESREGHQLERTTIYLERVIGIFRSLSRSHVYAFSVEAQETLLYLSGYSETDSQKWITALRCILWPPTAKPMLECSIGDVFKVSIIENLSSFVSRSRIASTVGYMITLPSVILLASLSTGSILVEWPWQYIHKAILMDVTCPEDTGKILCVEICSDVSTSGIYYFFSEKADEISRILACRIVPCRTTLESMSTRNSICSMRSAQTTLDRPMSTSTNSVRSLKITARRTYRKVSEDVTGSRRYTSADLAKLRTGGMHKSRSAEDLDAETTSAPPTETEMTTSLRMEELSEKMAVAAAARSNNDDSGAATVRARVRRKLPVISYPLTSPISYDNIPQRVIVIDAGGSSSNPRLDRRKSSSDSALSPRLSNATRESQRLSAMSTGADTENSDYEEISVFDQQKEPIPSPSTSECAAQDSQQRQRRQRPNMTTDVLSAVTLPPSSRPQSVYSCASQASRDSGVLSSTPDDAVHHQLKRNGKRKEIMVLPSPITTRRRRSSSECAPLPPRDAIIVLPPYGACDDDSRLYRKFTDFIPEAANRELENSIAQRESSSSDSTLYSEIDAFPNGGTKSNKADDPLYEDLDKFRKNIHKLLGIPQGVEHTVPATGTLRAPSPVAPLDTPPPLPPRKYSKSGGCPLTKQMSLQDYQPRRRKDVMKYLGVDKGKLFGSLDKLNATGSAAPVDVAQKRKDIYRYLGIPSMASSQPAGLNNPESTYDHLPPSVKRQTSLLQDKIAVVPSAPPISGRRSSRTYVRANSATLPANLLPPKAEPKPIKKRRLVFLKRKTSTKKQNDKPEVAGSTYVSYDCSQDDWDDLKKLEVKVSQSHEPTPAIADDINSESTAFDETKVDSTLSADEKCTIQDSQNMAPQLQIKNQLVEQDQTSLQEHPPELRSRVDPSDAYSVPSTLNLTAVVQLRVKDTIPMFEPRQPFYVNLNELKTALKSIKEDESVTVVEEPKEVAGQLNDEATEIVTRHSPSDMQKKKKQSSDLLVVECEVHREFEKTSSTCSVDSNYIVMTGPLCCEDEPSFKTGGSYRSSSVYMELDVARERLKQEFANMTKASDSKSQMGETSLHPQHDCFIAGNDDINNVTIVDNDVVELRKKVRPVPLICINDDVADEEELVDVSVSQEEAKIKPGVQESESDRLFMLSMDIKLTNEATLQELQRLLPEVAAPPDCFRSESKENYSEKILATLKSSIKNGANAQENDLVLDDVTLLTMAQNSTVSFDKTSSRSEEIVLAVAKEDASTVFTVPDHENKFIQPDDEESMISGDSTIKDEYQFLIPEGDLLSFSDQGSVSSDTYSQIDMPEESIIDLSDKSIVDLSECEGEGRVSCLLRDRLSMYIDQLFTESLSSFQVDATFDATGGIDSNLNSMLVEENVNEVEDTVPLCLDAKKESSNFINEFGNS